MRSSLALAFGVWLLALSSAQALDQSAVNWGRIVGTCVGYVHLKGGRDFEAVPWGTPGQVSVYGTAEDKALFRSCMWVTLKAIEDKIDANKTKHGGQNQ